KIENWIMNYEQNVKKYQSKRRNTIVTSILNDYASEVITKKELKESLTNLELAKNQKLIKDIDKVLVDANYQKYIEDERYRDKKVIWIYGDSGTGKSLLSQKLASEHTDSEDIFVTSSNRDPFQEYFKESVLIIEELRPETNISANEFLQLLDKTNGRFSAGSRYSNKKIMADVIIINTIHHPRHFFTVNEPFFQLARRIDELLKLDDEQVEKLKFNTSNEDFEVIEKYEKKEFYYEHTIRLFD